jgi:hypothetical protein
MVMLGGKRNSGKDKRFAKKPSAPKPRISHKRKNNAGAKPKKVSSRDYHCVAGYAYNPATGKCIKLKPFGPVYNGPCKKGWAINLATGLCHKI